MSIEDITELGEKENKKTPLELGQRLIELKSKEYGILECIAYVRINQNCSLLEAKSITINSSAWIDKKEEFNKHQEEQMQEFLEVYKNDNRNIEIQECNLNIRYDLPNEVLDKLPLVYKKMKGWIGFGENRIPYWFSFNENEKSIYASIEPSGLHFIGKMELNEWIEWKTEIKKIATEILEFKVGEIEEGEVGHEIEWLKKPNEENISNSKWWKFWN
ncbi:hypothetical protein [uncultured Maribacter sp.]|uniref:hypothetical protein n=1 Tax=uncultured Maribacter sp. TaxID=431308 RepID=UPI002636330C|nr:hypothetical protein [uncultured Maribacter sp.]